MKKQLSSRKRRAFTLIEMSLVLLIISLLLLVMLPNLNHQKNNADSKVNGAFVKNMETQVMLYQSEKEKIPPAFVGRLFDYGALDLVPPFDPTKTLKDFQLSERGKYIVLYMCAL